ncbi:MAG TPA: hypothetical protein VND98_03955 [Solirubrobacterales bacterium]|nr:hypothetical protein [Solirubrobacterales bacterium]
MRPGRVAVVPLCLFAAALLAGCGGGSKASTTSVVAKGSPAPTPSEFPSASGKSLKQVLQTAKGRSDLLLAPTTEALYPGPSRYSFEIFSRERVLVTDAKVAIYLAKAPAKTRNGRKGKKTPKPLGNPAIGPFPASVESLGTKPAFSSSTTAEDPTAAPVVYAAEPSFPADGEWRVLALVKEGKINKWTVLPTVTVGEFTMIPRVGQRAPLIHTPTAASVGGELAKITTRVPPDSQNQVDYASVLGKEPIVLLFATPKFCQSRTCSPVVDVAEQVKRHYGNRAAFIHMEIYNDNNPSKGVRAQVRTFHLPSVPWLFVINRDGTIGSEIAGGFGVEKLTQLVKKAIGE